MYDSGRYTILNPSEMKHEETLCCRPFSRAAARLARGGGGGQGPPRTAPLVSPFTVQYSKQNNRQPVHNLFFDFPQFSTQGIFKMLEVQEVFYFANDAGNSLANLAATCRGCARVFAHRVCSYDQKRAPGEDWFTATLLARRK